MANQAAHSMRVVRHGARVHSAVRPEAPSLAGGGTSSPWGSSASLRSATRASTARASSGRPARSR